MLRVLGVLGVIKLIGVGVGVRVRVLGLLQGKGIQGHTDPLICSAAWSGGVGRG